MVFVDSDILIKCMRKLHPKNPDYNKSLLKAREVMEKIFRKYKNVNITFYNYAELCKGAYLSEKVVNNLQLIESFCTKFEIVLPTIISAKEFARISANLENKGANIGIFDVLIASIVITNNDILFTNNLDHFNRIPEIQCQDWGNLIE